jgi:serine/threonine protein kinase
MNPATKTGRWTLVQEIFQGALERLPSERSEYVANACGTDKELRTEVESLLANDADAGSVLHAVVAGDMRDLEQNIDSEIGLQLGPYRLVRRIDSGGMGVVYLAVRSDDQYFQIVAIKMLRKGLESPTLVHRFRAERQILATLNHPNIGAILDGGETADGRPFIVMEYVEGQPITLACETHGSSIRQRIEPFRSVCAAVHYAHQKLIIHRDIKPSNVLVTPQEIVKLIDFGVSKPLAPEAIPGGVPKTETSQRLLTPDYASPEQLLGRELTTSTDIYSLGVLLFEILTGSRPYTLSSLSPAAAERVVCDPEPRKPSSVKGLPKSLRKELAGDLDRIVSMAMDVDPFRRYRSARHLEEDLVRYLEGRPVAARKATTAYRFRKFVRRHKTAWVMACLTIVIVSTSVLLYIWQSRRSDRRLQRVQALADSTISELTERLQQVPGSTEAQAALFQSTLKYLEQLRQSSANDPHLLLKLSKAYERVGDLEGSPSSANLGRVQTTLNSYEKALQAATEANARLHDEESVRAVVDMHERLGSVEFFLGNIPKAHEHYQQSLFLARHFWQQKPDDPIRKRLLAMGYARLGDLELDNLETRAAFKSYHAAFQMFGNTPTGDQDHDKTLSMLYIRMAGVQSELGSLNEALADLHKSIALCEDVAKRSPTTLNKHTLAVVYTYINGPLIGNDTLNLGDSQQAQIYARKSLALAEELAAGDGKNVRKRYDLSFAYEGIGNSLRLTQPSTAAEWYRKSLSLTKDLAPLYPAGSQMNEMIADRDEELAAVPLRRNDAPERLRLLQEANMKWQELVAASPAKPQLRMSLMRSYCKLSDAELALRNIGAAKKYADSSLAILNQFEPDAQSLLVLRELGYCYESMGNLQRRIAMDRTMSAAERRSAKTGSRDWYEKSSQIWAEWNRRGAATPESEAERRKVELLLTESSPQ